MRNLPENEDQCMYATLFSAAKPTFTDVFRYQIYVD